MYAIAAIIAGEVKEQTQPKNDKSEPAWNKRINKTLGWHGEVLAILNKLKKNVPTRQVYLKINNVFKNFKVKENVEEWNKP
jgi:hypothetical protein